MAVTSQEEESFNPLEIGQDLFSDESPACLQFEKDTRNYDTIDPRNEIAEQTNPLLDKGGLTKRWHVCKPVQVFFDETPPPSKTSPLVDDDLDEEEAIKVTEKKNLENDTEDETLEVDEVVNIKESKNHPSDNVFTNKLDENAIVFRNKARLVAQGYNQQEGIDYDETYALGDRIKTIIVGNTHTTNVDQLHAYLQQHERHANEVRLMHVRNSDPLALVASHQLTQPTYQSHLHTHPKSLSQLHVLPYQSSQFVTPYQTQQFTTNQSTPLSITYPSNEYQSTGHHNVYSPQPSIPQLEYAIEFPQPDSNLVVPVFQKGDDPIDSINHMMSFLTAVVTSRYPTTNNQLRTSSNPRQQATVHDGKVTVQPVQGRQTTYAVGTTRKYTRGASGSNTGKQRTVICYNCKGEGHISKQCTMPKRSRVPDAPDYDSDDDISWKSSEDDQDDKNEDDENVQDDDDDAKSGDDELKSQDDQD
ncbi:retrovirus-related pol polyprotein from transposon TNT 1-94, partial [Tanacetum coccineum]